MIDLLYQHFSDGRGLVQTQSGFLELLGESS
jgi:hypothetical protein